MTLFQDICGSTTDYKNGKDTRVIAFLVNEVKSYAEQGYTSITYKHLNEWSLSDLDRQRVVDFFVKEGFKVSCLGTNEPHLTIDWSKGVGEPCPQCGKYHEMIEGYHG